MRKLLLVLAGSVLAMYINAQSKPQSNEVFTKSGQQFEALSNPGQAGQAYTDSITNPKNSNLTVTKANRPEIKNESVYSDFPKFEDTGNPATDKERFYTAKQAWINAHPEEYKKLTDNRQHIYTTNSKQ